MKQKRSFLLVLFLFLSFVGACCPQRNGNAGNSGNVEYFELEMENFNPINSLIINASNITYKDQILFINSSIQIIQGGALAFINCTLYLENSSDPIVFKNQNGTLTFENTTINKINQTDWGIVCEPDSSFSSENSTFYNPGWNYGPYGNETGIYIHAENATFIHNTIISPYYGVTFHEANGSKIIDNMIYESITGILVHYSSNITVNDNYIFNAFDTGIWLTDSVECHLQDNIIDQTGDYGIKLYDNVHNTDVESNTIAGTSDKGISINYYCDNNTIFNNTIINASGGIEIDFFCNLNELNQNTISNVTQDGILVRIVSNNNNVTNNTITNCMNHGVFIQSSATFNLVENNKISLCNGSGVAVNTQSNDTTINDNFILSNGQNGIDFRSTVNNSIKNNVIVNNSYNGVYLYQTNESTLFLNAFIGNTNNSLVVDCVNNDFDNGSVGNLWSDYNGTDTNMDFIGEENYTINYNHSDEYPIMPTDSDSDGLYDFWEMYIYFTNQSNSDTDDDFLLDGEEIFYNTDPLNNDSDGDLLLDGYEIGNNTNPLDPDSDDDLFNDYWEILFGSDPLDPGDICFMIVEPFPHAINISESSLFLMKFRMIFRVASINFNFRETGDTLFSNTTPYLFEGQNLNATVFEATWAINLSQLYSSNTSIDYFIEIVDDLGNHFLTSTENVIIFIDEGDNQVNRNDTIVIFSVILISGISLPIILILLKKKRRKGKMN